MILTYLEHVLAFWGVISLLGLILYRLERRPRRRVYGLVIGTPDRCPGCGGELVMRWEDTGTGPVLVHRECATRRWTGCL